MTRKLVAEHGQELGQKYAKELEKQIRAIGAQRAMGYVTSTYMLGKGTQLAAMQALGWDQEAMDSTLLFKRSSISSCYTSKWFARVY